MGTPLENLEDAVQAYFDECVHQSTGQSHLIDQSTGQLLPSASNKRIADNRRT